MPLAMSRPWKHPRSGVYYLRKGVPEDLRELVGKLEEKRSLGTRDPAEAKRRHAEALADVEVRWATRRWLPSTNALIPVVYLLAKAGKSSLKGKDAQLVKRYLLISGLRSLFRGASETAVNGFINAIGKAKGDLSKSCRLLFEKIPNNRLYKIRKDDVRNAPGLYSPLMQTYLAYLYANEVKSWPSGRLISHILHEKLPTDPLAVHHIVPKEFMQKFDIPIDRLNTAANYAILSQADNAELGDDDPFDVWRMLKPAQKENASKQLFFVGKEELLKTDAYEEFIDFRAEKMAEKLNAFLEFTSS